MHTLIGFAEGPRRKGPPAKDHPPRSDISYHEVLYGPPVASQNPIKKEPTKDDAPHRPNPDMASHEMLDDAVATFRPKKKPPTKQTLRTLTKDEVSGVSQMRMARGDRRGSDILRTVTPPD